MTAMITLLAWFAMAISILVIGVTPLRTADAARATIGEAASHGTGWITLCFGGWCVIPLFETVYADFDTELPSLTKWLIDMSYRSMTDWHFIIPSLVFTLALDVIIFALFHRTNKTKLVAKVFSASITGALLLAILVFIWGTVLPFIKLFIKLWPEVS